MFRLLHLHMIKKRKAWYRMSTTPVAGLDLGNGSTQQYTRISYTYIYKIVTRRINNTISSANVIMKEERSNIGMAI